MATANIPPIAPRIAALVGGCGFIGTAVTEALAQAGWRIRIVSRSPDRALRLKPQGDVGQIGATRADIRSPSALLHALKGADLVVNLVGILDEKGGQSFGDLHVKGAANVAAAAAAVGARSLVHISAIGADASSPSAYWASKGQGEAEVRRAFPGAVILRPGIVFGAEDNFTNRFAKLMTFGPVIPVVAPNTRFQPVHVDDVAAAVLAAADRPGTIWELGGPEILSMRELMGKIAHECGHSKPLVDVPDIGARLLSSLGFIPGAPLNRDQYQMLQKDNVAASGLPGLKELGIAPTSLASIASIWLGRYRDGGRFAQTA